MASPSTSLSALPAPGSDHAPAAAPPASSPQPEGRETVFTPSPGQLHLLEALRNQEDVTSLQQFCQRHAVSRASLYRWQRNPRFRRWLAARLGEHLHCSGSILIVSSMNAALEGDPRLQLAMLKWTLNPNGLPAYLAYCQQASAPPLAAFAASPEEDQALEDEAEAGEVQATAPVGAAPDAVVDAASLPPPAGVLSATYRLLKQARATEANYLKARRAVLFARYMDQLKIYADREAELFATADQTAASAAPDNATAAATVPTAAPARAAATTPAPRDSETAGRAAQPIPPARNRSAGGSAQVRGVEVAVPHDARPNLSPNVIYPAGRS